MIKVGITGGIGAGKSFVCSLFEAFDIPVYYADAEAKRLMWKDPDLKLKIKSIFGKNAYHRNGRLNRKYLSTQIFTDKSLLKKMNAAVHPAVHLDVAKWFERQTSTYALEEAALIFESGNDKFFDKIITVAANDELRISRVMKRDKIEKAAVLKRMKNQLPQEVKIKKADFVVMNDGSQSLIKQVWDIHLSLISI